MRIPKFWARASRDGFEAPGWSFTSLAEAMKVAQERVQLVISGLRGRNRDGHYLYGDRPVKEPVIETIGAAEHPDAVVTRNAYGALCLNTEDVAFIDVDSKDDSRIKKAAASNSGWGLRLYRTYAGYRIIATHARMSPKGPEATALFDALGADPLYRKLCATQESFRARLTPKPWRVGVRRLPTTFPWRDEAAKHMVDAWVGQYDAASRGHAVCELVEALGPTCSDPVIDRIIALHDERTLAENSPLA